MSRVLARTTDSLVQLARVERVTARQLRAALLRLGGYLDWDERAVIRVSEAITGRPWFRCGAAEVVQVGRALLDIAVAVRAGSQTDTTVTAVFPPDQCSTGPDADNSCDSRLPVEIRRGDDGPQLPGLLSTAAQPGD